MRRYRQWAGNPHGEREMKDRCVVEVAEGGRSVWFHQCGNKRGYGPHHEYCRMHARQLERGRYVMVPDDGD